MSVGALIPWPYKAGGRSRRGSHKAGTTVQRKSTVRHTKCGRMRGMVVGEVQLMLLVLRVEGVGGGPISRKKALLNT